MANAGRCLVIPSDSLRILHLSDLHFSHHADESAVDSSHCPQLAGALTAAVSTLDFDLAIISGDLTDRGDKEALLRAREYLFSNYAVSGTHRVGLELPEERVRILPGNHDAFNMPLHGSAFERVQKSLSNYVDVFPNAIAPMGNNYEWIECKGWDLYLAMSDSCFVGDPDFERLRPAIPYLETTAKGKLANSQVRQLLAWSDRGRYGKLDVQDAQGIKLIDSARFIAALKVLVMHHYLFEPAKYRSNWTMQFIDRYHVFRNVALCDFDVLWCGHKHVPDCAAHTYGRNMPPAGRNRYLFNQLRHALRMSSIPMPETFPENRQMIPRAARFILSLFAGAHQHGSGGARSVGALIDLAFRDEKGFRKRIKELLSCPRCAIHLYPDEGECDDILQHIESQLTKAEREELWAVLKETMRRIVRSFDGRPFVQGLCGSATKRPKRADRPRGFLLHELGRGVGGFNIQSSRFEWKPLSGEYELLSVSSHLIPVDRFAVQPVLSESAA